MFAILEKSLEDYYKPAEDDYQSKQTYRISDTFNLAVFLDFETNIDDLF